MIDASLTGLEAQAKSACAALDTHEIVWRALDGEDVSGIWDAVLVTPGPTGIPAAVIETLARNEVFSVEVQPQNTHRDSPDHSPTGTQALFLGAGADSYRTVLETLAVRGATP